MKKTLAIILAFCMLFATTGMAFASSENTSQNLSQEMKGLSLEDGYQLLYQDYSNGDVSFFLMKDDEMISKSYVNRTQKTIENINYIDNTVNVQDLNLNPIKASEVMLYAANGENLTYTTAGTIHYSLIGYREGVEYSHDGSITMQYASESKRTVYTINGKFKDITAFAGLLASVLAMPAAIAANLAGKILSGLGIAASAIDFLIPDKNVIAVCTKITWKAKGLSSTFSGKKYYVTYDDGTHDNFYEGDFFPTTSIKNEDKSFAMKVASKYFPTFKATVKEWVPK